MFVFSDSPILLLPKVPCCARSGADPKHKHTHTPKVRATVPFVYIVYFGGLSGNQAVVHHLKDSNTKVKSGLVCLIFFYLWQITAMSDKKKFACRTNFKLYQTFCLVKIFLRVIAWDGILILEWSQNPFHKLIINSLPQTCKITYWSYVKDCDQTMSQFNTWHNNSAASHSLSQCWQRSVTPYQWLCAKLHQLYC